MYGQPTHQNHWNLWNQPAGNWNRNQTNLNNSTARIKVYKYYNLVLPIFEKHEENPYKFLQKFNTIINFANIPEEMKVELYKQRIKSYNYEWESQNNEMGTLTFFPFIIHNIE